jgi:FKBP-type peptidyl-prolyl cis-trans isomerase (trigger factor)
MTEARLEQLFELEVRARAPHVPKPADAQVGLGDWVEVQVVAYAGNQLLPEYTAERVSFLVQPDSFFPGFGQALVGARVNQPLALTLPLPAGNDRTPSQGELATFHASVVGLEAVTLPEGAWDSPGFLTALGLPAGFEQTLLWVGRRAEEGEEHRVEQEALDQALDQLVLRAQTQVSEEAVDSVLGGQFVEGLGRFLLAQGVDGENRELAARAWLDNPAARARTRRSLQVSLVLQALAREHELTEVESEDLEEFVADTAGALQGDPKELLAQLEGDKTARMEVAEAIVRTRAANLILEHTEVEQAPNE